MLEKPTTKTLTTVAIQGGSMVAGAKVGDAVAAILPDSMNSYKKIILAVVGIGLAAAIPAKTTGSTIAQSAALGMGGKALYDELTDLLTDAVPVKVAAEGASLASTDKFVNALVGHKDPTLTVEGLSAAWGDDLVNESIWDRPVHQLAEPLAFTGV